MISRWGSPIRRHNVAPASLLRSPKIFAGSFCDKKSPVYLVRTSIFSYKKFIFIYFIVIDCLNDKNQQ